MVSVTDLYFNFSRGAFQVNLKGDLSGVHFSKFKGDWQKLRFDIYSWSLIDSPVNDLLRAFSPVLIRKTLTQVCFDDVVSIAMMSTAVTEDK